MTKKRGQPRKNEVMETKLELQHGKWYKGVSCPTQILQHNSKNPHNCYGYVLGEWTDNSSCSDPHSWQPATYAELEALGTQHREHYVFSLDELREGVCAVNFDSGNSAEIIAILKHCFPNDSTSNGYNGEVVGSVKCFYFKDDRDDNDWYWSTLEPKLPFQSVTKFYEQLPKEEVKQSTYEEAVEQLGAVSSVREFETGATRNLDQDKLDFDGFLSPLALEEFAKYMHKNRVQADGKLRDSDNWQKGIPIDAYMKSMYRHFFDTWKNHRGFETTEEQISNLCGLMFNVQGMLHEILKSK